MAAADRLGTGTALLVTDSFRNSVNGISVFSHFFVEDVMLPLYHQVMVLEAGSGIMERVNAHQDRSMDEISVVYVNAHFSSADFLVRKPAFRKLLAHHGFTLASSARFILISHGWTKIKLRLNHYSILYGLKNIRRAKDLARLHFYSEVVFISEASDDYRHKDYRYCVENGIPTRFYDFSARFIQKEKHRLPLPGLAQRGEYIMVVANFQAVKNLWWLLQYNFIRKLKKRPLKRFLLLIHPQSGFQYKLYSFFADKLGVTIVSDQRQKAELTWKADYLFIPSFTEYNPVVALEAEAAGKKVVSLFPITTLKNKSNYHCIYH